MMIGRADNRRVIRGRFKICAVRIRLHPHFSLLVPDREFVEFALGQAGHEQFPHARSAERAHRMIPRVPRVEITHERHARGIGCPDSEGHARDITHLALVRAEFFVDALLGALVEKIKILIAQRGQKGIRVVNLVNLAPRSLVAQLVTKHAPLRQKQLVESLRGQQIHRIRRCAGRIEIHQLTLHRPADKSPGHHALLALMGDGVHPQPAMGVGLAITEKGFQFELGNNHDPRPLGNPPPSSSPNISAPGYSRRRSARKIKNTFTRICRQRG